MRVVFLEDVAGVAKGGDVREVKNGFAPKLPDSKEPRGLPATHNALQGIQRLTVEADETRPEDAFGYESVGRRAGRRSS